jgi:hypothetical protein
MKKPTETEKDSNGLSSCSPNIPPFSREWFPRLVLAISSLVISPPIEVTPNSVFNED